MCFNIGHRFSKNF